MKQNQVIAICDGVKSNHQKLITKFHHELQKEDMLSGFYRSYQPVDDEGEKLPDEKKVVQINVKESFRILEKSFAELFDTVGTQEKTNTLAAADLKIDGITLLENVPVTYLLFLEKQTKDIQTFLEKLPVLDPVEEWEFDPNNMCYKSKPKQTSKTKKILHNHIKAEATKEHPAQVEVYTLDETVGYWTTVKISGAIPKNEKIEMLERLDKLQKAIKIAREEANNTEVEKVKYSEALLHYLF